MGTTLREITADNLEAEPVGFGMLSWDIEPQPLVELVREQGGTELLTSHVPGEGGPAGFYARLGFEPRGDLDPDGEVILRLPLGG